VSPALLALPWAKIIAGVALAAAIGGALVWHASKVDAALARARTEVRAEWAAAEQAREDAEIRRAADNRARAEQAAAELEAARTARARELQEARDAARKALRRPIHCPAGQSVAVGDVVVPADALVQLRGMRKPAAADARAGADRPAAGKPRGAVPAGDVRLADLIDVWQAREAAAAECRAKHAGLVKAWPQ
jgi:hypothetical protein